MLRPLVAPVPHDLGSQDQDITDVHQQGSDAAQTLNDENVIDKEEQVHVDTEDTANVLENDVQVHGDRDPPMSHKNKEEPSNSPQKVNCIY